MKKWFVVVIILFLSPIGVDARRGCCSRHGGVAGCNANGRQICNDGTLSPTCTCTPPVIYGCTDSSAKNYNPNANRNNGKCIYYVKGCTDKNSINYNAKAEKDDGSCIKKVLGCTNKEALNYDSKANTDDGSCIKRIEGCMDNMAINYNKAANVEDYSCVYPKEDDKQEDRKSLNVSKGTSKSIKSSEKEKTSDEETGSAIVGVGILGAAGYFVIKKKKKLSK